MSEQSGDWGRRALVPASEIVMVQRGFCKNRDKLITLTVRVRESSLLLNVHFVQDAGLRLKTHTLANGAHRPVLYIFLNTKS